MRRKRLDASGTIHYLGAYERNLGNGQDTTETVTTYYHALGRLIAFRRSGVLFWVGTDHLGTQSGRADWRRAHPGWVLGDDDHTGVLPTFDTSISRS